ncbi:MAG: 23S rRNA (guanosine(2251)-2'-O)-methyltransferase RlmB [Cellulomonadaceae bacterium]|nr:23S rRNA (guanosine(2251)-2'-O)-methyltransferase RlmB [Cellulomonadaceae bacterium]
MAGNSERRGATRKPGSKKGAVTGSGGKGRRALEGKGPTPKAEERTYHPAYARKQAAEKRAQAERQRGAQRGVARGTRRSTDGTEVIAGRNSLLEALRTGVPITQVYIAARIDHDDRTREILELAAARSLTVYEASRRDLDEMTDGQVHQGIAAQVPPYEYGDYEDLLDKAAKSGRPPLIVALDGITDPRNLGAVLRSAGAFGVHGVLVPERRAAGVTASAWKVSAGAAAHVPVARATNLARALAGLKKAGCFVVGLDGSGTADVGSLAFAADPMVLVVGSEGSGMGRLVREACDEIAAIPFDSAAVESLNAGVATSIALYEIAKARRG